MTVNDKLLRELEASFLHKVVPKDAILEQVLSLDGEALTNLTAVRLSQMSFTLSQYVVYLQMQYNVRLAKYKQAKRIFETKLYRALSEMGSTGKLTVAEKKAKAVEESEELKLLEEEMAQAEAEEILFSKIPDQIVEMLNTIKKELSRRENSRYQ